MNTKQLLTLNSLLGGTSLDFDGTEIQEVQETEEQEIHLSIEEDTPVQSFLENFSETFDRFNAIELNESEISVVAELDIADDLANIQEALDNIREKILLKEDIGSLSQIGAIAIPGLSVLGAALVGALVKAKASGEATLPKPLANLLHDIKTWVTKGDEKERREIIRASLLRSNPKIDKKDVEWLIDIAMKKGDEIKKHPTISLSKDSRVNGKYETDFAKINKKRFGLE